ncbi:hypothetical protein D3C72_838180 [compost metagenome]
MILQLTFAGFTESERVSGHGNQGPAPQGARNRKCLSAQVGCCFRRRRIQIPGAGSLPGRRSHSQRMAGLESSFPQLAEMQTGPGQLESTELAHL